MILPTKHLSEDRALIGLGAVLLGLLDEPKTVSRLWEDLKANQDLSRNRAEVTYDWFVLCLDLLFAIGALHYDGGVLRRSHR